MTVNRSWLCLSLLHGLFPAFGCHERDNPSVDGGFHFSSVTSGSGTAGPCLCVSLWKDVHSHPRVTLLYIHPVTPCGPGVPHPL